MKKSWVPHMTIAAPQTLYTNAPKGIVPLAIDPSFQNTESMNAWKGQFKELDLKKEV
jgi:hypothetical protein